jgi:CubicO group peptidase (beta-lactamase class C family)
VVLLRLAAVAVAIGLLGGAAVEPAGAEPLRDRIATLVKAERQRGFCGAVLVVRQSRPVLARGVGFADRRKRVPNTPRTVFDLGSITKPLTLAAALALVEDGRLALSDRLGDLLPGVPDDKRSITLRQLLEHRAGLPEYVVDGPGGDFAELSREQALRRILRRPLRFRPGARYGYSDAGYTVTAAVIEDAAGRPFERFLRERILERGGMASAGFYGGSWPRSRVAVGQGGARHGARNAPDAWSHVSWSLMGAGGVAGSARDLRRWTRRLWRGKVLAPATVRTYYEILAAPSRLPRGDGFVLGYAGGNDYGFNSVVVEGHRGRRLVIVLANAGGDRAERLARRLAPLLFPRLR